MRRGHEIVPDPRRQFTARDLVHGRAVIVADPHTGDQIAGEAHEEGIAEGLARACLSPRTAVGKPGGPAGALRNDSGEQLVHGCHHTGRHGLAGAGAGALEHALDLPDAIGNDPHAAIGECGIGAGQLNESHGAGPERNGEIGRKVRGDAETARGLGDAPAAGPVGKTDSGSVQRLRESLPHGDGAAEPAIEILRRPSAHIDSCIGHHVVRAQAALQRRQIDEQLEGRARLAKRLSRAVELAGAVVPAAHHGPHGAVGRHCDKRCLGGVRRAC